MRLNQFLLLSPIDKSLVFLIFLFPSLAVTVKHGGTTIYILLFLISTFSAKATIKSVSDNERYVIFGFLIFVAVMLFGFINTDDYRIATHQLERYLRLILLIPIFLMLIKRDIELSRSFLFGCVFAALVMAIQAFIQVEIFKENSAYGAYHKIVFGDIAIIIGGVCVAGLFALGEGKRIQVALVLGVLLSLYASLQSYSRSSWLAVIAMAILLIILYKSKVTKKQWKKIGLGFVILLIIGSVWQPKQISKGIQAGINDIKQYRTNPTISSSFGDRINMWQTAWLLFLEKPVTGIGVGDYRYESKRLMDEGKIIKRHLYGHAHNYYLNVLVENGIIGLIALVICIFFLPVKAFYLGWNKAVDTPDKKFWSLTGLVVLTCFFVFGIAEVWLGRNTTLNVYCVLILVSLAGINEKKATVDNI